MLGSLLQKFFGNRNARVIKRLQHTVAEINALEPRMQALDDVALRQQTQRLKERLAQGEILEQLLPEAFATVREASRRVLHMRHFDVQLIGGMVLHGGNIAEMRTGEGKTLVATLATYLNALSSQGVHVVTVNDYLARRDAEWMRPLYEFLGLSVGVIVHDLMPHERRTAYGCDITYGTNNEFGFDYLRDNMAFSLEERVQRNLHFAVIDEVDSILIDEARTPLIISGPAEDSSELYRIINQLIPTLKEQKQEGDGGDYLLDLKTRQAYLTEIGHEHVEERLIKLGLLQDNDSLYNATNITLMHHVNAALRARALYHRDVDYIVRGQEVIIVDEHTGRAMPGRRWSEGLHQAVEAKENVPIQNENQTLASITFQNYFRLYNKLSGMTGTADTEAYEFQHIYGLEVIVIPTNKEMVRKDLADQVYLTVQDKFTAIVRDIKACVERQQPVLVGTASIETSELVARMLQEESIKHQVLNAKFHEQEAQIVAEAGRPGAVTIATNMAGRGTDIVLGGNLEAELAQLDETATDAARETVRQQWQQRHDAVIAAGGLHVIGTERHESRRIDNQLRGRSGRQGDPGSSRFYLSLEDNLMRIFAADRLTTMMQRLGMPAGEPIEHTLVTKVIENAQRKVEGHNFDIRKQLLEYDNVANEQRKVIYAERTRLMQQPDVATNIVAMRQEVLNEMFHEFIPPQSLEDQWDIQGLQQCLAMDFGLDINLRQLLEQDPELHEESLKQRLLEMLEEAYRQKETRLSSQVMRHFEKSLMLQCLDNHWREHLAAMDHLRQGIHLRGYAQKDPKQEYKREAFALFKQMLDNIRYAVISVLSTTEIRAQSDVEVVEQQRRTAVNLENLQYEHAAIPAVVTEGEIWEEEHATATAATGTYVRPTPKVGRNEPCPCGSGKKYKHCHGHMS